MNERNDHVAIRRILRIELVVLKTRVLWCDVMCASTSKTARKYGSIKQIHRCVRYWAFLRTIYSNFECSAPANIKNITMHWTHTHTWKQSSILYEISAEMKWAIHTNLLASKDIFRKYNHHDLRLDGQMEDTKLKVLNVCACAHGRYGWAARRSAMHMRRT